MTANMLVRQLKAFAPEYMLEKNYNKLRVWLREKHPELKETSVLREIRRQRSSPSDILNKPDWITFNWEQ